MTEGQGGTIPAGWYPDPEGNGERWWNGISWGELRQEPGAAPQQPGAAQAYGQQPQAQSSYPAQSQPQSGYPSQGHPAHAQPAQAEPNVQPGAPQIRCVHCGWHDFTPREFLLNTRGMTLFGADAFNAGANCLICQRCGFIHWFATR